VRPVDTLAEAADQLLCVGLNRGRELGGVDDGVAGLAPFGPDGWDVRVSLLASL
jgi:hypothetical protein